MALAYLRPRPLAAQPECDLSNRSVALCICAYNEAPVIARTIKTMLSLRGVVQRLEILVYVDAATDETTEILRGFGDSIRLIVSPKGTARHTE